MPIKQVISGGTVPVKIWASDVDPGTLAQLRNLAGLPFIHSHVAAMPDVHLGLGATVGSVIPTRGAIIPAAVGVDIGCGMNAVRLSLEAGQLPDSLRRVRTSIEAAVPVGFHMHERDVASRATVATLGSGLSAILDKHPLITARHKGPYQTWSRQLGTLGGGNHFIEICLDESDHVWIMLHSGSRGIGNAVGRYFIERAREAMGERLGTLADKDLAFFRAGDARFDDYIEAVHWAQCYALANRREIMRLIVEALGPVLPPFEATREAVNCHHNYLAIEHHFGEDVFITRKGAIRAGRGELGIIPGSMGTHSYIVRGLGNASAFHSCAHGAGRRLSRTQAKKRFDARDLAAQTANVECRKDKGVVDEIPAAYKDIDEVMRNQADLVAVVHTLTQVVCVKG